MNEPFRLRKSIQIQAIVFILLFLAMGTAGTAGMLFEEPAKQQFGPAHSRAAVAAMFAALFGGMTFCGVLMLAAYHVEQVKLVGTRIFVRSLTQNRQFDVVEIDKLAWKWSVHGGSVRFHVANCRTTVDLHGYSKDDRLRMIRLFHGLIPADKQANWPMFCEKNALPLRDERGDASVDHSPLAKGEVIITRRRYDRLAGWMLPMSFIVAGGVWWATGSRVLLGTACFMVIAWLFLRFTTPPEGQRTYRVTAMPGHRTEMFGLAACFGTMLMIAVLRLAGVDQERACTAGALVLVPLMTIVLYGAHRADKRRKDEAESNAKTAPERWDAGELARLQSPHSALSESARH